jgi:hypothetical protein
VNSPFLEPVAAVWARVAGIAMLVAGAGLTAVLGLLVFDAVAHEPSRRALTSSSLIEGLILLALCGICWQAGYRLAVTRSARSGELFSRPAWLAIGTGLVAVTALMAAVIVRARGPTLLDLQVILFLGGIGVWCVVLAFGRRIEEPAVPSPDVEARREAGDATATSRRLTAIKLAHTAIWALLAGCIVAIPVLAWQNRFGSVALLAGIVLVEVVVLWLNRWNCPLTAVAARHTTDRRANFDIFLPAWLARYNKPVFGSLYVAGVVFALVRYLTAA